MKKIIPVIFFFILTSFIFTNQSKSFRITYFERIEITGSHEDDLPEYIVNLKCKIDGQLFYEAKTGEEFEFENTIWEKAKQIDKNRYQLLLELNDRPNKSKILLLTVEKKKLTNKQILPSFDTCFYNSNKTKEFAGNLEYAEGMENPNTTQYIPTLFYTDKQNGIELDTAQTLVFNKRKWGKFYGYEPNFNLILTPHTIK